MDPDQIMKDRIVRQEENDIIILNGLNYIRARRVTIGSFSIVIVEWNHPNYGYFADAMLWIRSIHMRDWEPFPIVTWTERYKNVEQFLEDYPEFKELFEEPDNTIINLIEEARELGIED